MYFSSSIDCVLLLISRFCVFVVFSIFFFLFFFFFFKQKTAYEMLRSLVGSEMCIRDSGRRGPHRPHALQHPGRSRRSARAHRRVPGRVMSCLLYTSDAADDLLCVDLGGRRIIKKKKHRHNQNEHHTRNNHYLLTNNVTHTTTTNTSA